MNSHGVAELPRAGESLGAYELVAILGRGGMGQVYAARDALLDREVAIKVLWEGDRATLVDEGRALAAIDHRSVVRIYGIDVEAALPFVIMERIRGESLDDFLDRERVPPVRQTLRILRGVATGLDAIHAAGRVHGDVKPANVLLEPETGRVVLTDLGLSRAVARAARARGGTPEYLAPERARSIDTKAELFPREDVYSLAVMAYEMLVGVLPFEALDALEVLRRQAFEEPPRPSRMSARLTWRIDRAILAGLRKDPEARPATATDFVDELERAVGLADVGPRILVADDDGDLAKMLAVRLAKRIRGSVIRTVGCGESAYDLARRETPDAIVTDLEMPGMNGLELLAACTEDRSLHRIPVAVVSGHATERDFDLMRRVGATMCLPKPVDVEALRGFLSDELCL